MKTSEPIFNAPAYASRYPYIVARRNRGRWYFYGAYQCATLANNAAIEIGGVAFYNRAAE